jgi:hypothetical protein
VTDQVMDKLKSKDLIIIAGDTLPPQTQAFRDGRSHAQVGQRPFEMGYRAPDVMIQLINGESGRGPALHRPRRLQRRRSRLLRRQLSPAPKSAREPGGRRPRRADGRLQSRGHDRDAGRPAQEGVIPCDKTSLARLS